MCEVFQLTKDFQFKKKEKKKNNFYFLVNGMSRVYRNEEWRSRIISFDCQFYQRKLTSFALPRKKENRTIFYSLIETLKKLLHVILRTNKKAFFC